MLSVFTEVPGNRAIAELQLAASFVHNTKQLVQEHGHDARAFLGTLEASVVSQPTEGLLRHLTSEPSIGAGSSLLWQGEFLVSDYL